MLLRCIKITSSAEKAHIKSIGVSAFVSHAAIGSDVSEPMHQVQGLFEEGFEGCTTIAQRRETGGMV